MHGSYRIGNPPIASIACASLIHTAVRTPTNSSGVDGFVNRWNLRMEPERHGVRRQSEISEGRFARVKIIEPLTRLGRAKAAACCACWRSLNLRPQAMDEQFTKGA